MRKIYTFLFIVSAFYTTTNAQTIKGMVTDEITKEGLIGVNIILNDGSGTSTDIDGKYQLQLQEGKQTITFKYIGYQKIVKEVFGEEKKEEKKMTIKNE